MSGGVDSSLAAVLMLEQGYEVIGITLKTYDYEDVGGNDNRDSSCCSIDGINMARSVADKHGFPHYVFDFSERFKKEVIDGFVAEYMAGRTPNPCVVCNRKIKWEYLLEKAESLGAKSICTGHYAGIRHDDKLNRFVLSKAKDPAKDQSYALYGLTQNSLSRTLFPLSGLSKKEVRAMALERGLASATKPESYEICFVADNDYTRFLRDAVPGLDGKLDGGEILYNGRVIGNHRGYAFYTIGQRKGLGVSNSEALYVKSIDPVRNAIIVDVESGLLARTLKAESVNFVKYDRIPEDRIFKAKIRYKDPGVDCRVVQTGPETINVEFLNPRRAITPGQSVVVYEEDDLVAGGVISEAAA